MCDSNTLQLVFYWNIVAKVAVVISIGFIQIWPTGVLIGKSLDRWDGELSDVAQSGGLSRAGFWIGGIERTLIFIFILTNQFTGVGFLIAAKSIFRFGELNTSGDNTRKLTEYFLIGTLLSFTLSILLGILGKFIISLY